jgi:DNA-binding transcriptional ArsR family regulator
MTELQETGESLVAEALTFGSGAAGRVLSHPLPNELVELIAERFRVLSEPIRIKLLERLGEGEASVLELTDLIGTTQQNVSKHLGMLQRAGIVARRKQGNFAYYRIVDEAVFSLCEVVCGSLQQQVESRHQLLERR